MSDTSIADITYDLKVRLLGDTNADVQWVAITSLGLIDGDPELAVGTLTQLLHDPNPTVTGLAVQALADIADRHPQAAWGLAKALHESTGAVRQEAALGLWEIKHDTNLLLVMIFELPAVQNDGICARMLTALGEMGPIARPATPQILSSLTNRFRNVANVSEAGRRARASMAASATNSSAQQ
jgi:hypothetical protein